MRTPILPLPCATVPMTASACAQHEDRRYAAAEPTPATPALVGLVGLVDLTPEQFAALAPRTVKDRMISMRFPGPTHWSGVTSPR